MITTSYALGIILANATAALLESGTTEPSGYFEVYTSSVTGTPDAMPSSLRAGLGDAVPLFRIYLNADSFEDAVENPTTETADVVAKPITPVPATGTGDASFFRMFDRDNVKHLQGNVTAPNLGGNMELSSISVVNGVNVVVQSLIIQQPV